MSKESLETLELVEDQYRKMIGTNDKNLSLTPVLPNLITSTDEVTIFATSSQIHNMDSFYLIAKPTYTKNQESNSDCRNNYNRKSVAMLIAEDLEW